MTSDTLPIFHAEYSAFERLPDWDPAELAEQGPRILTRGPARGRPWKNDTTAYLVHLMQWFARPRTRVMTIEAGNQVGKTEFALVCWSWAVRYMPGPAMYCMATEEVVTKQMKDRIMPMVQGANATPYLAELITGVSADQAQYRLSFANGALLYPAWYGSQSTTESFDVELLIKDEPDFAPDPGDLERIDKRVTVYPHTSRILNICKPMTEGGPTHTAYVQADVRFLAQMCCPNCYKAFPAHDWRTLVHWPKDVSPTQIRRDRLAYIPCPHCDFPLDDHGRDDAVRLAKVQGCSYAPDDPTVDLDTVERVAWRIPTYLSPFVSLSQLAAEFILAKTAAKHGDIEPLRTFVTARLGEPWKNSNTERDEDFILGLRDERPVGRVPRGAVGLTAGIDTQDDGFWYVIRAWANPVPQCLSSYLIRHGFVHSWGELDQIMLHDRYADEDGHLYAVARILQDAMGHRTAEVYEHLRAHSGYWLPTKGNRTQARPHFMTTQDTYPGGNRPIPGGLQLVNLWSGFYKDKLNAKLRVRPGDPGEFRLHADTDEDYARQMCAEARNPKTGFWEQIGSRPNHLWDDEYLAYAAQDMLGLAFWTAAVPNLQPVPDPEPEERKPQTTRRLPW